MNTTKLQLVTVDLENGEQGIFVGWPLVSESADAEDGQVENIWFSNVQDVPDDLTLKQLMELVRRQLCACRSTVQ